MKPIDIAKAYPIGSLFKPLKGGHAMTVVKHDGEYVIGAYNTPHGVRLTERWYVAEIKPLPIGVR